MTYTYSSGLSRPRQNFRTFCSNGRLFNSYLRYDLDELDVQNGLDDDERLGADERLAAARILR